MSKNKNGSGESNEKTFFEVLLEIGKGVNAYREYSGNKDSMEVEIDVYDR